MYDPIDNTPFVAFQVPTTSEWNVIWDNDTKLASGDGIEDNAILTRHLLDSNITSAKLAAGVAVQVVAASFGAVATGTGVIPRDDTIPQISEGTEFMTLAITPKSATNVLVIDAVWGGANSIGNDLVIALFQDANANALAATSFFVDTVNGRVSIPLRHNMVSGTASSTTFSLRAGPGAAGTVTFNGASAGTRHFGTITKSNITITEYKV